MKGEKKYQKGLKIINNLQENFQKFSKQKVLKEHAKYIKLIRQSAYIGNSDAQFELGLNYEDQNYFVPNPMYNIQKRFYWYLKASNSLHPQACNNLASLYERGDGTKKDLKMALSLYKKAYELGCAYAKNNHDSLALTMK